MPVVEFQRVTRKRKLQPPAQRRVWTEADKAAIARMREEGMTAAQIAAKTRRSPAAVEYQFHLMNLAKPKPGPVPAAPSGTNLIAEAKAALGTRLVERKGVMFLDGVWVNTLDLLKAYNRDRKRRGEPLIGKAPERWM